MCLRVVTHVAAVPAPLRLRVRVSEPARLRLRTIACTGTACAGAHHDAGPDTLALPGCQAAAASQSLEPPGRAATAPGDRGRDRALPPGQASPATRMISTRKTQILNFGSARAAAADFRVESLLGY